MSRRDILAKLRTLLVVASTAAATACATTDVPLGPAYNKYSTQDIVAMAQAGDSADQIIRKLAASGGGYYPLRGSDWVKLHDQGVPPEVLDFMQATYVGILRHDERFRLPQRLN